MEMVNMAGIVRINRLYNTLERPGRLGISRSTFYDNFVWHSDDDPFIPNTDVPRLKLLHLAPNAAAAFDDEVAELEAGLKRWRDEEHAEREGSTSHL
jgi:hypothetical protein